MVALTPRLRESLLYPTVGVFLSLELSSLCQQSIVISQQEANIVLVGLWE